MLMLRLDTAFKVLPSPQLCAQILVESEAAWRALNVERSQGDNVTATMLRLLPASSGDAVTVEPEINLFI
jgi:hypothetical protein